LDIIVMDFTYDSYDSSTLKVNFQNLRKAEQQAFWIGLVLGTPIGTWLVSRKSIQHKFAAGPLSKVFSSLMVGSLMYHFSDIVMELGFLTPGRSTTRWLLRSTANTQSCSTRP
jgi:hypothetical protein